MTQIALFFRLLLTPAYLLFVVLQNKNKDHNTSARPGQSEPNKIPQTFRLVPFASAFAFAFPLASFPLFFDVPFLGDVLGWTVKNPSSRPCCLLFKNFASLSAPLRTRSSLHHCEIVSTNIQCMLKITGKRGNTYLNPFSVTKNWTRPSTSGFFHSSYKSARQCHVYQCNGLDKEIENWLSKIQTIANENEG